MGRFDANTVTRQFKRTFSQSTLNEMGKAARLCQREREVTPWRLMLTLIESFSSATVDSIADIQRTFNALCETEVRYKPFHNQLVKAGFPQFVRSVLCRLLDELACNVLRFTPESPFARFNHIRIQDGTSFALKSSLSLVRHLAGSSHHHQPGSGGVARRLRPDERDGQSGRPDPGQRTGARLVAGRSGTDR